MPFRQPGHRSGRPAGTPSGEKWQKCAVWWAFLRVGDRAVVCVRHRQCDRERRPIWQRAQLGVKTGQRAAIGGWARIEWPIGAYGWAGGGAGADCPSGSTPAIPFQQNLSRLRSFFIYSLYCLIGGHRSRPVPGQRAAPPKPLYTNLILCFFTGGRAGRYLPKSERFKKAAGQPTAAPGPHRPSALTGCRRVQKHRAPGTAAEEYRCTAGTTGGRHRPV